VTFIRDYSYSLLLALAEYENKQPTLKRVEYLQRTILGLGSFCLVFVIFIVHQNMHNILKTIF